jgi:cytochrome P450
MINISRRDALRVGGISVFGAMFLGSCGKEAGVAPFQLNTLSDEFRNNRIAFYKKLRDDNPVVITDQGIALISRYADVQAAAVDTETFSSGGKLNNPARPKMNTMDPPDHGMYVAMMNSAFDKKYQDSLESDLRTLARSLVTKAAERTQFDLMVDVLTPYMFGATGIILGLNDEQLVELEYIGKRAQRQGAEPAESPSPTERSDALFLSVLADRRAKPGNDHVSALLAVGSDGGRALTEAELLEYLFIFINGTGITAVAAIGNGVELLARHPEQRAKLVADPSLIPNAFKEMNRLEGPTHESTRITTREVTVAGVTLPANTPVFLMWGAADLDERQFASPEEFDISRDGSQSLAMGIGEHFCYGGYLARLEARIFFEELLAVMPNFTLSAPAVRIMSTWSWGFESIPVSIA